MKHKVYVTKGFSFEACHNLPNYKGDCSRMHGHTYKMEVTISRYIDSKSDKANVYANMVIDFKELKRLVKETVLDLCDHHNLNEVFDCTTAEYMVIHIYSMLKFKFPSPLFLEKVKLWETENSFAEYMGEFEI
jgi:6-pyruvoyltetrahydropterin/6-carboxytetrahydropterin synthase